MHANRFLWKVPKENSCSKAEFNRQQLHLLSTSITTYLASQYFQPIFREKVKLCILSQTSKTFIDEPIFILAKLQITHA